MSKPAFTPGPWNVNLAIGGDFVAGRVIGWHVTAQPKGSCDAICERTDKTERSNDEERANARLIAKAPDLYHSLAEVLPILRAVRYTVGLGKTQLARIDQAEALLKSVTSGEG